MNRLPLPYWIRAKMLCNRFYFWLRYGVLGLPPSRRAMRKFGDITQEDIDRMWERVKAKLDELERKESNGE